MLSAESEIERREAILVLSALNPRPGGEETMPHLRVLVDEYKGIRHVPVTEVNHTQPDPRSHLTLNFAEDLGHGAPWFRV